MSTQVVWSTVKKHISMPHTFVLLFLLVLFGALLTYLVPAGEFNRIKDTVSGQTLIVPGSYHLVKANPVSLYEIPVKLFKGLMRAADIVFFIFIVGGSFEIINRTNMINAFTGRLALVLRGREAWAVPIFLSIFSVGGFTMGMSSEILVFVPIGIVMARSLGFDVVTGTAMVMLGAHVGFTAGLMNPFGVGIAQAIVHIPIFSGMGLRIALLLVLLAVTSAYILRYAYRVKADPSKSIVADLADLKTDFEAKDTTMPDLKAYHWMVLVIVIAGLGMLIWGVNAKKWWIDELAATFLTMGILSGFAAGYGPSKVARYFVEGAKAITFGALVVGLARSILVVVEDAKIIDSIVFNLSSYISVLPPVIQPLGMYAIQIVISLIIVSASGMATVTMPIMGPLAELLGITKQTAVLMFQCADGMTHAILPTSAATMGALSVAKIPFERWIKFALPLELLWLSIGGVFVVIAHMIGYQ